MSAYSIEVYMPVCDTCGWEGEPEEFRSEAEQDAQRHDAKHHPHEADGDNEDPRTQWLTRMDELVEAVRQR